jgi:Domain of unknown function (DUF4333)
MPFTSSSSGNRRLLRGAALAAVVALAGCTQNLNMDAVKKSVSEGLASQLGLTIASVDCPATRPTKAGDTFECVATPTGGGRLTVKVSQRDEAGNVSWEVAKTEGLLDIGKVEGSIRTGLKEQAKVEATASCGGRWRAAKAGDTFECQATTADGQTVPIVVSVTDEQGNISWATK